MKKRTVIILSLFVIALIALNELALKSETAVVAESGKTVEKESTGEALVGGEFELIDQNGNKFTSNDLLGKYSLVYFGFTHCKMICPTALSNMSLAVDGLGKKAKDFQIVFITADPERDDQARIKEWLSSFKGDIIGLTGTPEQVKKAGEKYKIYAQKLSPDGDGGYDVSHTSIIYVMDKNGKFVAHFNHETPVDKLEAGLKKLD